jgi:hypothetical protein
MNRSKFSFSCQPRTTGAAELTNSLVSAPECAAAADQVGAEYQPAQSIKLSISTDAVNALPRHSGNCGWLMRLVRSKADWLSFETENGCSGFFFFKFQPGDLSLSKVDNTLGIWGEEMGRARGNDSRPN